MAIAQRLFGKTGPSITRVGLGGEGVLRTFGREREAKAVIEEAAAQGINYFDSAQAYAGSEGYYGTFWRKHLDIRSSIFQTSKSAARDYGGARLDLAQTLRTMDIERLDLWQIHDIRTREDIEDLESHNEACRPLSMQETQGLFALWASPATMIHEYCFTQ